MKNKIIALSLSMVLALSSTSAFAADKVNYTNFNIYDMLRNYGFYYEEPAPSQASVTTAPSTSNYEQKVVELVNIERQKNGLKTLTLDSAISNVARIKSKDMSDNNYFAHQSPTYGSAGNMLTQFGIKWSAWGENIAAGQKTPEEVVKAWMNSEGHRANILSPNFSKIGVGYVNNGRPNWTQMFTN